MRKFVLTLSGGTIRKETYDWRRKSVGGRSVSYGLMIAMYAVHRRLFVAAHGRWLACSKKANVLVPQVCGK